MAPGSGGSKSANNTEKEPGPGYIHSPGRELHHHAGPPEHAQENTMQSPSAQSPGINLWVSTVLAAERADVEIQNQKRSYNFGIWVSHKAQHTPGSEKAQF